MKASELFEVKELMPWVADENANFKALLKRFGFSLRKKPFLYRDRWTFGGEALDTVQNDLTLPIEKRVAGAQKAIAKHLFELNKSGREVVVYQPSRYDYVYGKHGVYTMAPVDFTPRGIYQDDSIAAVEALVKDRFQLKTERGVEILPVFQYGVSAPVEKQKEPEKKALRVVKANKG